MIKKVLNIYFFLFFFVMINRECTPFGLDLRFICFPLAFFLFFSAVYHKRRVDFNTTSKWILLFYIMAFLCNISWIFNHLQLDISSFLVIIFSYVFNLVSYFVFLLYKDEIFFEKYEKYIYISLMVLIISMSYNILIGDLHKTFLSTYSGRILDLSSNFLGGKYRIAGFAQDPNYASLFLIMGLFTVLYRFKESHDLKIILFGFLLIFFYLFSSSKTILVAIFPVLLYVLLNEKVESIFKKVFFLFLLLAPVVIVCFEIPIFKSSITMHQRLTFWDAANHLFLKNPLLGNGLTSFRSYFASLSVGWYVQCHSTLFQILCETGVISFLIFSIILFRNLHENNKYVVVLTLLYSVFMVNTETLYHIYAIFFIGILPIIMQEKNKEIKNKASIFLVNSLGNGGAERVVSVLANKMSKQGNVFIFTVFEDIKYKIDSNITIIGFTKNKPSKLKKIIMLPYFLYLFHKNMKRIEQKYEIAVASTHLIYSHLLCCLSMYRFKFLYVIHNPYYPFDLKQSFLFKKGIQMLYNRKKMITVSKGVEKEMRNRYQVSYDCIETVYNPVDSKEIEKKASLLAVQEENYILFCGRLNRAKRPLYAIDFFYNQGLYKNYKLLMIGTGELLESVKQRVKNYHLENRIILKGWQENPYAYMKKALVLLNCSLFEAFPMTMIEAFSCNCMVVSFDIDYGPSELLKGKLKSYLVKNNDDAQLKKAILKAIKNPEKDLSKYVIPYQTDQIVNRYYDLYRRWFYGNG